MILEITNPDPAAALDLLRALVRPARAPARNARRRPRGLHVSARVGQAVSAAGGPGADHGSRRPRADPRTPFSPEGSSRSTPAPALERLRSRRAPISVPPPVTRVLDAAHSWLPQLMARGRVPARRRSSARATIASLCEAAATLAAGGKRLRPMLVLVCAGPEAATVRFRAATAIELVHMATLVHDDVLDAAPLRRGRPTVVARTSRDTATAVGDLLLVACLCGARDAQGASTAARSAPPPRLRLQERHVALLATPQLGSRRASSRSAVTRSTSASTRRRYLTAAG